MTKYRKKPVVVEAEPFKEGMHDGYACYDNITGEFIGFHPKTRYPKVMRRDFAIKTLEGWYPVFEGKHMIITGVRGERYPCEIDIFNDTYERVED
jgi:hypothetical protein